MSLFTETSKQCAAGAEICSEGAAAKAQLCGQIGIAQDNGESRALALGRTYAEYGTVRDVALLRHNIEAVTAEDIRSLAAEIFAPERLCRLVYMPKAED